MKTKLTAGEVAGYENRLAKIEGDVSVLKWIGGTNIVLTLLVLAALLKA